MLSNTAVQVAADPHVFLVGHPPMEEFIGYVNTQTLEGRAARDNRGLADAWRAGNDRVRELEVEEAGYADSDTVGSLPAELAPLAQQVLADPIVQRTYSVAPIAIGMVELDRLVVYQKQINLAFVDELIAELGDAPSDADAFDFALPYANRNDPPVGFGQVGDGGFIFKSVSTDFRILGVEALDPQQVTGLNAIGVPTHVVAVTVGYGANYLSVLSVEGRLVLNNGSHRAYTLRKAGQTHAPAIVQQVSRREELPMLTGSNHVLAQRADDYLKSNRPPLFKDYMDPKLHTTVHVPRNVRQVQVGFSLGQVDLPA